MVPAPQRPSRDALIDRVAASADRFGRDLQGVVARERYLQTVRDTDGRPTVAGDGFSGQVRETRHLLSSLLLVHDARTPWQLHRDVVDVDGRPVADRRDRLARLFADPAADRDAQLRRITEESARYNLGRIIRNINIPTFPLIVVHPSRHERFRFRERDGSTRDGVAVREIAFDERGDVSTIGTTTGYRVRLRGTLVVEQESGELVEALLTPRMHGLDVRLQVWFARVEGLPVRVPVRLRESYWRDGDRTYIAGEATYDEFRRYGTDVGTPVIP